MLLNREDFGDDFAWGVSTAAYQIEGAHDCDSKGLSIWDVFVKKKNKIFQNHHGDTACDFYNRYMCYLYLIHTLNRHDYQLSLCCGGILPTGDGEINDKGDHFYNMLIALSLERGIAPRFPLYQWDLPYALVLQGGWINQYIKDRVGR